jgi:iron complex outermembrane recepter protein
MGGTIKINNAALVLALACVSPLLCAEPRNFNIPSGDASTTITEFARQADVAVVFSYDLAVGRRTHAIQGALEVDSALKQLLTDSGLTARREANGQLIILDARQRRRTQPTPGSQTTLPDDEITNPAVSLSEVHITGSRLGLDGMTSPTPVAVISAAELQLQSPTSLVDALVQLPHFLNNDTPQTQSFGTAAAAGASYLNLRGIGSIRTLTLLDGRRIVPASRFGTVDIALLPRNLVRRVEVVTGGASAAYGSDAISGVVNILLDSDFQGLQSQAQTGISDRGDNEQTDLSLAYGAPLGDYSRLVLSAEYSSIQGILGYSSRDWFASWAAIGNPDASGPRTVIAPNVHATGYTYGGLITSGPLAGNQFLANGTLAPFARGAYYTTQTQSGGNGVDPAADLVWILPDQQRANVFAKLATQMTPELTAYAQLLGGISSSVFQKAPPSLWGPWEATIFSDNAWLSNGVRSQMQDLGVTSFRMGRLGNADLGANTVKSQSRMLSITLGAQQQLARWQLDGYYQFGNNHQTLNYDETLRIDRIYRAIDSVIDPGTGLATCRSTLSFPGDGCVPINLFGPGSVTGDARRYVTEGRSVQAQDVQEHAAEISLQTTAFHVPAGDVDIATGVSWRRESVSNTPHRYPDELNSLTVVPAILQGYRGLPAVYSGSQNIFEQTVTNNVVGGYSVGEIFGEGAVPLLHDARWADNLTAHLALRYARYSGSGTIAAWKTGIDWQLPIGLRLRATRSRDVRAGSLSERFDVNLAATTIIDTSLPGSPVYAVVTARNGNPNVDPERSDTTTAGLVFTPAWASALSLAIDYFDIQIRDAISTIGAQNIINRCKAGSDSDCALISRTSSTGPIRRINNLVLNVAEARSRGLDIEASWRSRIHLLGGDESLALRLFANRSLESSTTGISGTRVDRSGQTGLGGGTPRWQTNMSVAYLRPPWQISLQSRFVSSGLYDTNLSSDSINDNTVSSVIYTNLRITREALFDNRFSVYVQASNLFDRNPPRAPSWGFVGSVPTNESLFDVLGRRFAVGVRWEN